ncbi:protein chromatin remodeling 8 [Tanacetum coccineum]
MTGAPIQNRLSELWSLFDFVFSGKLGVQSVFEAEFVVLISIGGYVNASPMKVSTVYRMKAVVNAQLPTKTDHVLFCSLTDDHRAFLASSDREHAAGNHDYGNPKISGKMKVVAQVLKVWKEQGHRVLLFAQTQQILDIIENFMIATYTYRIMDGLTPVKQRMTLMDEFNNSPDIFTFIFDTKVGWSGVYDFLDDDLPSEYYKELLYGIFQKQKQSKKHMDYEQVINVLARNFLSGLYWIWYATRFSIMLSSQMMAVCSYQIITNGFSYNLEFIHNGLICKCKLQMKPVNISYKCKLQMLACKCKLQMQAANQSCKCKLANAC